MIKPIPKRLLPHNCVYQEYLGNTGEGDNWGTKTQLNNVKIEEKTVMKFTSNGREVVGNARMFYDLVNSEGLENKPIENSIINFNGINYKIEHCDVLCADSPNPHHYEVLLK